MGRHTRITVSRDHLTDALRVDCDVRMSMSHMVSNHQMRSMAHLADDHERAGFIASKIRRDLTGRLHEELSRELARELAGSAEVPDLRPRERDPDERISFKAERIPPPSFRRATALEQLDAAVCETIEAGR